MKISPERKLQNFLQPLGKFNDESLMVISALLSKKKSLNWKAIAKTFKVEKQETVTMGRMSTILIFKKDPLETTIVITSEKGVDTLKIETKYSLSEIAQLLKKSKGIENFAVRINSSYTASNIENKPPLENLP